MISVPQNIRERISADVVKYVEIASKHFGRSYDVPRIHYDVRGTTAGYATGTRKVDFNSVLLMENTEKFLARTVPHEVAHCIDTANGDNERVSWSGKRKIHGPSWKRIMKLFGVQDIGRCHSYDVANSRVKTKRKFEYKCVGCGKSFFVSSVIHNKMRAGQFRYDPKCGKVAGKLVFSQSLGQVDYGKAQEIAAQRAANKKPVAPAGFRTADTPEITALWNQLDAMTGRKPGAKVPVESLFTKHKGSTMDLAKDIWLRYGHKQARAEFIDRMVSRGVKATTASTYFNKLKTGR